MTEKKYKIPFERIESMKFPVSKIIEDQSVLDISLGDERIRTGVRDPHTRHLRRLTMRGRNNRKIKVNRADLIKRLELNLQIHVTELSEALEGWKFEVEEELKATASACRRAAKNGAVEWADLTGTIFNRPEKPVDYSSEYTKVIRMFEVELAEDVELTGDEIEWYIHDEWEWSSHHKETAMGYMASNARRLAQ